MYNIEDLKQIFVFSKDKTVNDCNTLFLFRLYNLLRKIVPEISCLMLEEEYKDFEKLKDELSIRNTNLKDIHSFAIKRNKIDILQLFKEYETGKFEENLTKKNNENEKKLFSEYNSKIELFEYSFSDLNDDFQKLVMKKLVNKKNEICAYFSLSDFDISKKNLKDICLALKYFEINNVCELIMDKGIQNLKLKNE